MAHFGADQRLLPVAFGIILGGFGFMVYVGIQLRLHWLHVQRLWSAQMFWFDMASVLCHDREENHGTNLPAHYCANNTDMWGF
jgi:hypothetical protein